MVGWSAQTLIVMAIPLSGAALGTIFWSRPQLFKIWGLLVITATWLIVAVHSWMSEAPSTLSLFLMHLITLAGFLTILSQHPQKAAPRALCLTLLFTGLGLGYVTGKGYSGSFLLCGILGLLILALVSHRRQGGETPWFAIGILVSGILSLLFSVVASGPVRILAQLVPLAIVWPLLPVQGAFVASVSHLPGILPAFLAVLLPSVGFFGLTNLLPVIPEGILNLLWVVGIVSALYGSLLALSQDSMDTLLGYAHMSLGAILWWYVAVTQSVASGALLYLGGLSLVTCGLFLLNHSICTRFGHLDLNTPQGFAHIMPRFSTLFVLFITAALGLPLFTLFSAFMEMMLNISSTPMGSMVMILLAWLMASWYFPRLMQQLLFGHPPPQLKACHDLQVYEVFSLIFLLALLVMLGMAPSHWFGAGDAAVPMVQLSFEISQDGIWNL